MINVGEVLRYRYIQCVQDLVKTLHSQGLSKEQVEIVFSTIQEWLDAHYPILAQVYRTEFLEKVLNANKKKSIAVFKKGKAA